jgi:hypothetical protein
VSWSTWNIPETDRNPSSGRLMVVRSLFSPEEYRIYLKFTRAWGPNERGRAHMWIGGQLQLP